MAGQQLHEHVGVSVNVVDVDEDISRSSDRSQSSFVGKDNSTIQEKQLNENESGTLREWVPYMLRRHVAAILVALFLVMIAILEIFEKLDTERHGFPVTNHSLVLTSRYVPTVIAILLSYFWSIVARGFKKITPWSVSDRWVEAEKSLLINYTDGMELKSLMKSLRNKHWGVSSAILGALFCGLLSPFTNTLFYVDPVKSFIEPINSQSASSDQPALIRTSSLQLNNTFSDTWSDRALAAIMGSRRFQNPLPVWTTEEYVFESFNLSSPSIGGLNQLSTTVGAWTVDLNCAEVNYNLSFIDTGNPYDSTIGFTMVPDSESTAKTGCQISPNNYQVAEYGYTSDMVPPAAWLNITPCDNLGQPAILFTAFAMTDLYADKILQNSLGNTSQTTSALSTAAAWDASGLICQPKFQLYNMSIVVNATSAEILEFERASNLIRTITVSDLISTTPPSIGQNPQHGAYLFLSMFEDTGSSQTLANVFVDQGSDLFNISSELGAYSSPYFVEVDLDLAPSPFVLEEGAVSISPWFYMLSGGNLTTVKNYARNPSQLLADSTPLFQSIFAQLVNTKSRNADSTPLTEGSILITGPRLTIRRLSLRFVQGVLAALSIITLVSVTIFRLHTCLVDDPGTLGAMAVIAAANPELEQKLKNSGLENEKDFLAVLAGSRIQITRAKTNYIRLEPDVVFPPKSNEDVSLKFLPLTLRWYSRLLLMVLLVCAIVALGLVGHHNWSQGGFRVSSTRDSEGRIYATNFALVLLSHGVGGVIKAIRCLWPYQALKRSPATANSSILNNPSDYSLFTSTYRNLRFGRSFVLVGISVVAAVFPAIKIVAAGLYLQDTSLLTTAGPVVNIDNSLIANAEKWTPVESFTSSRAISYVQDSAYYLTQFINDKSYSFTRPAGTLDGSLTSFVFANLSSSVSEDSAISSTLRSSGLVNLEMPSIQIKTNCTTLGPEDMQIQAHIFFPAPGTSGLDFNFTSQCKSTSSNCIGVFGPDSQLQIQTNQLYRSNESYFSYFKPFTQNYTQQPDKSILNTVGGINGFIGNFSQGQVPNSYGSGTFPDFVLSSDHFTVFSCSVALRKVNVNSTLIQPTTNSLGSKVYLPPMVTSVDEDSVIPNPAELLNLTAFDWIIPSPTFISLTGETVRAGIEYGANGELTQLNDIDMLSLLARGEESLDLEHIISNPKSLTENVMGILNTFCTQEINLLRPFTNNFSASSTISRSTTLTKEVLVIKQDEAVTVALMILLAVVTICLLLSFLTVSIKPILPKPPNSIGAQLSLVAGSQLVRELREEGVSRVKQSNVWENNKFGLGWCDEVGTKSASDIRRRRWGVDIARPA